MKPTEFGFWRTRNNLTGKKRTTRYPMTETTALNRHSEASKAESADIRNLPETHADEVRANTTSSWQRTPGA
ncbi:MAG: hypothetical protein V4844_02815 [Pseudomonadota bacterium]